MMGIFPNSPLILLILIPAMVIYATIPLLYWVIGNALIRRGRLRGRAESLHSNLLKAVLALSLLASLYTTYEVWDRINRWPP